MIKHFLKKKQNKIVVFRNFASFVFANIHEFQNLACVFQSTFSEMSSKNFSSRLSTFANEPYEGNSWDINSCGKENQCHEIIPGNCFDKIDYPSKSYFQITVHEKLPENDKWLQPRKGATANLKEKKQ